MKIGFTGTQLGMNQHQKEQFILKMQELNALIFIHGDCIGADSEAHDIVRTFFPNINIVIFPPIDYSKRAFKSADLLMDEDEYLTRNKMIVDHADFIFAAPKSNIEEQRSGTWSTVRYARKKDIPVFVLER